MAQPPGIKRRERVLREFPGNRGSPSTAPGAEGTAIIPCSASQPALGWRASARAAVRELPRKVSSRTRRSMSLVSNPRS